jgi:6-pyruvoyltetrahydropterin/6-carboxytetrahydropterin synthase
MIRVTRSYVFSAAHVLARPDWSDERNREVYGRCANPAGHGHNYRLEVTLRGELDPATGRLVPLERLDQLVRERILERLDHRFLNRDVPEFEQQVPTAENIARFAWLALKGETSPAVLDQVRLVETSNNSVVYCEETD